MRIWVSAHGRFIPGWLLLIGSLILAGCTPASISPGSTAAPAMAIRPTEIVVHKFAVSSAEVTQNQSVLQRAYRAVAMNQEQVQQSELQTGHEAAKALADDLVKGLTPLGFKVQVLAHETAIPENALVIDGQFLNVDEGNRLRRLVIGFGAGASKLDTEVNVSQATSGASAQLLSFKTHADSGRMPGAAATMGAGAAAQGGATAGMLVANGGMAGMKIHQSTVDSLADSTAKQIVAYFSQYAASQNWISQDQVQQVDYASPQ